MKVDRSKIEKNLQKKGFRREAAGHHIHFYHEFEGKETGVTTYISHSQKLKDVSGDLLTCMRRQLRLDSNRQVVDLVNCPMKKEEFNGIMIQKGLLEELR